MRAIEQALTPFDEAVIQRILAWANAKFLGTASPPAPVVRREAVKPVGGGNVGVSADSASKTGPVCEKFASLAEFFHAIPVKTEGDKALVVGAWLQETAGVDSIEAFAVNKELRNLGYPINNITRAFDALIASRPALIVQIRKTGNSRQARKAYRVTDAGFKHLRQMLLANLT
jgi:hypothetical protein